jgi:hypothetical protein
MQTKADTQTRIWLAAGVVVFCILGITAFSIVALLTADDTDQMTERLLTAVLPLFGTWVGTVLAFYFARENFQAATESTLRLQSAQKPSLVTDVMIPETKFVALDVPDGTAPETVTLQDIQTKMGTAVQRLPIRDSKGVVHYIVHASTLTAWLSVPPHALTDTIQTLLDDADTGALLKAIAFVSQTATVAEARNAMASTPKCNDVFVTASGKADEKAIGWLTNTDLAELP